MRLKHPIKRGIAIVAAAGMIASGAAPAFADAYGIAMYGKYYVDQGNVTVDGNHVTYHDWKKPCRHRKGRFGCFRYADH